MDLAISSGAPLMYGPFKADGSDTSGKHARESADNGRWLLFTARVCPTFHESVIQAQIIRDAVNDRLTLLDERQNTSKSAENHLED